MLEVHYANELDTLAVELAHSLRREVAHTSELFEAPLVLVPDPDLATYLKLGIARINGICAGLQACTPSFWAQQLLPERLPDGRRLKLLRREQMQLALMALLQAPELLEQPGMAPLRAFFPSVDEPALHSLRVFQLAKQLSTLFEAYHLERPEMLALWHRAFAEKHEEHRSDTGRSERRFGGEASTLFATAAHAEVERWQRAIYLLMLDALHGPAQELLWVRAESILREPALQPLFNASPGHAPSRQSEGCAAGASSVPERVSIVLPRTVHLFAFVHLPRALRDFVTRLAERTHVVAWSFNPCMEFWEDVGGRRSVDERNRQQPLSKRPDEASAAVRPQDANPATSHQDGGRTVASSDAGESHPSMRPSSGFATDASWLPRNEPLSSVDSLLPAEAAEEAFDLRPSLFEHRPPLWADEPSSWTGEVEVSPSFSSVHTGMGGASLRENPASSAVRSREESVEALAELTPSLFATQPLFEVDTSALEAAEQADGDDEDPELGWQSFELEPGFGEDNLALQLWGRPGREHTRWLNEVSAGMEQSHYRDPLKHKQSILAHLQHDILRRIPPRTDAPLQLDDDSVRILCCPSLQREAELVAGRILDAVLRSEASPGEEPLRFTDIAVYVPREARQATMNRLQTVFSESYGIPCHFVDLGAASLSRVYDAIGLLLALPLGKFPRDQMLALFTHPSFRARFEEVDAETWTRWCDELGVVHGADRQDHSSTYINFDLFNWDQGVKRLVLGSFLAPAECDSALLDFGQERYAPYATASEQRDSVALFSLMLRSLVSDARFAAKTRLDARAWAQFLTAFVNTYLAARSDNDARAFEAALGIFDSLAQLDNGSTPLDYRLVQSFVTEKLSSLVSRRGQFLAEGVLVAPLCASRVLPFRMVVLMGLGEGAFPSNQSPGALDLRAAEHLPMDISAREQDMYLLLCTLMNTRERLVLSYVARDELTGEAIAPSVVVDELRLMLERDYTSPRGRQRLLQTHPQHRFDPRYFPELSGDEEGDFELPERSPQARREARTVLIRQHLERSLPVLPNKAKALLQQVDGPLRELLGPLLECVELAPAAPTASRRVVDVKLSALRRFLENPLAYYVYDRLGLRHEEGSDERLERVDELFESENELSFALDVDVLLEAFGQRRAVKQVYGERVARLVRRGVFPLGPFAHAQRARDLDRLYAWQRQLRHLGLEPGGSIEHMLFGRPHQWPPAALLGRGRGELDSARSFAPLHFELHLPGSEQSEERVLEVFLHGRSGPMLEAMHGLCFVDEKKLGAEQLIGAQLDALVCRAAGLELGPSPRSYLINTSSEQGAALAPCVPLSAQAARDYLESLLLEMLTQSHLYLLPIGAVAAALRNDHGGPAELERQLGLGMHRRGLEHLPLRELPQLDPPPNAAQLVERRFAPFLHAMRKLQVLSP